MKIGRNSKRLRPTVVAAVALVTFAAAVHWFDGDCGSQIEPGVPSASEAHAEPVPKTPVSVAGPSSQPKAHATQPLWHAVNSTPGSETPTYNANWSTEGRVLVRVSGAIAGARHWQVGDQLAIALPQLGETYLPLIDEIDDGPLDSRAALGKIVHRDGRPRRFVVTVGPLGMFAFVDTPAGSYELVADADYGWLVPTTSMMAAFDFSLLDVVRPDAGVLPHHARAGGSAESAQ